MCSKLYISIKFPFHDNWLICCLHALQIILSCNNNWFDLNPQLWRMKLIIDFISQPVYNYIFSNFPIGYGHISPSTFYGRMVTIFYSIFGNMINNLCKIMFSLNNILSGIPLMLLCLNNIGDSMATTFR